MGILNSFSGMVRMELTSADMGGLLTAINSANIPVFETVQTGDLSASIIIFRSDYSRLTKILEKRGEYGKLQKRKGFYWTGKLLARRPLLIVGVLILLTLSVYLPTRILFIQVEGNLSVPSAMVLNYAEECGVHFGASRALVRSERVKNALLASIPELQWVGVNTSGCVATISVRERTQAEPTEEKNGVASIVASRDGVVQEITVTRGNAVCKVGQAVKAGEILVSGYTDCGIMIRATRAEAEVFAQTERQINVILPENYVQKAQVVDRKIKYGLLIGKKRINFYKDSGISVDSCDKMYSEYYLTLPGGFCLPIAVTVEEYLIYESNEAALSEQEALELLESFSQAYMQQQMISGRLLQWKQDTILSKDAYFMQADSVCFEMIGRTKSEETILDNGENN